MRGVRYCAGEIVWHNIDPSINSGRFFIVRVPGIVRGNFRDTYPRYIGPPTVLVIYMGDFLLGGVLFFVHLSDKCWNLYFWWGILS